MISHLCCHNPYMIHMDVNLSSPVPLSVFLGGLILLAENKPSIVESLLFGNLSHYLDKLNYHDLIH